MVYKNIETERVIKALNELVKTGVAKSFYQIAKQLEINQTFLTDLNKGKKTATMQFIAMIISKYKINRNFIYNGEYPIINKNLAIDVKAMRESLQFTRDEFAFIINTDTDTLDKIELNELELSKEMYNILLNKYGEDKLTEFELDLSHFNIDNNDKKLLDAVMHFKDNNQASNPNSSKGNVSSLNEIEFNLSIQLKELIEINAKLLQNNEKLTDANTKLTEALIRLTDKLI